MSRTVDIRMTARNNPPRQHADLELARSYVKALVQRAAVSASDSTDLLTFGAGKDAFFRLVVEQSVLGRLEARKVSFNQRFLVPSTGTRGYWVGESKPVPVSRLALEGDYLKALKVGALIVLSNESVESADNQALVIDDVVRAVVLAMDEAFLDAANTGSDSRPAAITAGVTPTVSTGSPAADIAALVEGFEGDLDVASLVTDPHTAASAALARDAGGGFLFPALGPRGGSAVNIPVLTSRASPRDSSGGQWALVDAAGIASALESLDLARSNAASISMSDEPESESVLVNLFQAGMTAYLGTLHGNWKRVREGSVGLVTAAAYSTSAS